MFRAQDLVFAFLFWFVLAAAGLSQESQHDGGKESVATSEAKADEAEQPEDQDGSQETTPEEKKPRLRQINLSGTYADLVEPLSFDPMSFLLTGAPSKQKSFYRLCQFIDDLTDDDRFDYVAFDLSAAQLALNSAQLDELSRHIQKLNAVGKKTYAWLENASNVHLAIAADCDEVIMADFGGLDMPSVAMQAMFYRDAMDLIGVKASVVRAGQFKGAVEPYLNSKMSSHLREHYLEMLKSINDAAVDRIAAGRGMKHAEVRKLQAKRILLPKAALAAGLVDRLAAYGSMQEAIRDDIGEPIEWVTPKEAAKKQMSLFQLMGQMMSGPSGSSGRLRDNSIVVLHLSGPIVDGKKRASGTIVSGPTVSLIGSLAEEEKVKGVVVRINSPGGSATASEAVRQALQQLGRTKPTVVSMGNVAASGGYWISCIDTPVYAEKATITGSIGVFSLKLSAGALMRRVGVHLESLTLDQSAALFSLDRSWSEEDNQALQGTIDMVYDRFLELVSQSRGIDAEQLEDLAGGRVWSGTQAKKLNLVDQIGGVDACLEVISKKAGLDDYHVVHRPVPRTGLDLSEILGTGGEDEIWTAVPGTAIRVLKRRGFSLDLTRLLLRDGLAHQGKPTAWLLSPVELAIE